MSASPVDGTGIHDPAFILPTGGTTGKPKAVTLWHHNLIAQAWQLSHWSRGITEKRRSWRCSFFHSYALSSIVMMGDGRSGEPRRSITASVRRRRSG